MCLTQCKVYREISEEDKEDKDSYEKRRVIFSFILLGNYMQYEQHMQTQTTERV